MKKIISFFLIIIFVSSLCLYAQTKKQSVKDDSDDKVSIINSSGKVLIDINNEDDGGSITIPPITNILDGDSKLYNIGNELYWNNIPISQLGSGTGWSLMNNIVSLADPNHLVGIGTQNPQQKLHVENGRVFIRGIENWFPGITIHNTVGRSVLHLKGTTSDQNFSSTELALEDLTNSRRWNILHTNSNTFTVVNYSPETSYKSPLKIDFAAPTNSFVISTEGNVGIGTVPNSYKLAVAGSIISEEVVVKLQSNWPDYVFSKNYQLESLDDVSKYIKKNQHLRGIPPAEEIMTSGINVGYIQSKLLEKIEELTLYIIQQNDELKILKEEVANLKEQTGDNQ